MTKEQAIEILEGLKKSNEACIKSSKIEDTPFTTIWKRQNKSIEKVLTMLEEKDKEIDKLKKHNDDLLRKLRNRVKEVKKLQKYSLYKEEFSRLNKQLQNKDKIIDLMAERLRYYNGMQQKQEFCIDICEGKECNIKKCKERIKQLRRLESS